jgi:hypothetical protein
MKIPVGKNPLVSSIKGDFTMKKYAEGENQPKIFIK